jgi:hypothetical protein
MNNETCGFCGASANDLNHLQGCDRPVVVPSVSGDGRNGYTVDGGGFFESIEEANEYIRLCGV